MRTEFIQTKIRPIKKLFIIEPNDFSAFIRIIKEIMLEVDAIQNLIFINEDSLWNDVNREFIKRHDADIILNLSQLDDSILSKHFEIKSIKPISYATKITQFGIELHSFTIEPFLFNGFKNEKTKVFVSESIELNSLSLLIAINFGFYDINEMPNFKRNRSIFKNLEFEFVKNITDFKQAIFNKEMKLINLTTVMGAHSQTTDSLYEKDCNDKRSFEHGRYTGFSKSASY